MFVGLSSATDTFFFLPLYHNLPSISQSLRVQLLPPGNALPLNEETTNNPVENSESAQYLDTSRMISLLSTTTLLNNRCSPNDSTSSSWNLFPKKISLASGVPVFWLKLQNNIKQQELSAMSTIENFNLQPVVTVPYDRVIGI
jgi:hypothetical protein